MNETSTKTKEVRSGEVVSVWKIQSTTTLKDSLDRGKQYDKSFISFSNKVRECSCSKSSSKDDERIIHHNQPSNSKRNPYGNTSSSFDSERSSDDSYKKHEPTNWRVFFSKLLSAPFLGLIWVYRTFISPIFPSTCIYNPTCSKYSYEAVSKYGLKGIWMSIKRVARCRPGMPGGHDPVP
jgi:uncharacterized protein